MDGVMKEIGYLVLLLVIVIVPVVLWIKASDKIKAQKKP